MSAFKAVLSAKSQPLEVVEVVGTGISVLVQLGEAQSHTPRVGGGVAFGAE